MACEGAARGARGETDETVRARGETDFGDRDESVDAAVGDGDRDVFGSDRVDDGDDVVVVDAATKADE